MNKRVALSWSGGKDSCMALDVLKGKGIEVACFITTVPREIGRTFGHGEKMSLVKLQGEALNIPVEFISCTFEDYTLSFETVLKRIKEEYGLDGIAFGDLYLEGHREWGEKVAESANLEAIYPLWGKKEDALQALQTFIESGYQAVVIRVREDILDDSWLGKRLDFTFLDDIKMKEICPMGESGEYHTFVFDGPLFNKKIVLTQPEIISLETTKKLEFLHYELKQKETLNG
ncbi:Dph6-related ATP pyrophosphatase [Cytobacillus dafuensis]|uniref:Diphthine--ammonia ligase n=1 Tax=Cytobacillus dafuensis TaxID=1742359 RepID=A0A5B8Z3N1_CYTDA|nr:diphthine--ammonia ligase [Cytobacillus dafuensis]QED47665.1 diphthine--ammonia ligase [Cytobacillus dafuensis]